LHLGLRPWLRLDLRLWSRLHLRLRTRLRLRPGLNLRLGPRLHLGLRAHLGFYLRRRLRLRFYLTGGGAALQSLVFKFLLPPLFRCQSLGPGGQGRGAALGGPWSSRGGWGPRADNRVEFSRFDLSGWRATGLHLDRFGRGPDLSRFRRGARLDLRRPHLSRLRLGRRRRFEGLRLRRLEPLLRRQLLNLLSHLGGQGHGGPRGQRRARQALARL